jgi:hypothetical protein
MATFRRNADILLVVFGILLSTYHHLLVQGRTWVEVIDTSIYAAAMVDPYRDTMSQYGQIEQEETWGMPTEFPTTAPTSAPQASIVDASSRSPSPAPTQFTCANPNELSSKIRMYDSWGDGWGDTTMVIAKSGAASSSGAEPNATNLFYTYSSVVNLSAYRDNHKLVFEGSLLDGYDSYTDICLEANVCYSVEVNGTNQYWQDEIKWDIRSVPSENATAVTLAKGKAPAKCQFSIPDSDNSTLACAFVCEYQDDVNAEPGPTISPTHPSFEPSDVASSVPSSTPTVKASDFPSSLQSDVPVGSNSGEPSLLPTSPGGWAIIGTSPEPSPVASPHSLQPSMKDTMMTTTFIPTITMQPTISAYPTITAFPTIGGADISLGTPSGAKPTASTPSGAKSRSEFFTDDDAPFSLNPSSSSSSVYPTTPTPMPTDYGGNFLHHSRLGDTSTQPSAMAKESSLSADALSAETLTVEDDAQEKSQPTPSVVGSPSSGYAVLSPSQASSRSYGSAALSPAQIPSTGEDTPSYGSAVLSPAQTSNGAPVRSSLFGSAVLSPAQTTSRPSATFGSAALSPTETAPISDPPQYSPTYYMIFGSEASPASPPQHSPTYNSIFVSEAAPANTPLKVPSESPTLKATTFIPTTTSHPTIHSETPVVSSTRNHNARPVILTELSEADRKRIREEYKLRHSSNE